MAGQRLVFCYIYNTLLALISSALMAIFLGRWRNKEWRKLSPCEKVTVDDLKITPIKVGEIRAGENLGPAK